jgi:ribosomal protein S6--L-glutamate ligase
MMGQPPLLIGWREWAKLPMLNIPLIKVKIDTGAKTSALHAYDINIIKNNGKEFAEFIIHPIQRNDVICQKSRAEIIDILTIRSSNGHSEKRILICSPIQIGSVKWDINITLTNRDIMNHRMLLGREAMAKLLVNPSRSYCQGVVTKKQALIIYKSIILPSDNC